MFFSSTSSSSSLPRLDTPALTSQGFPKDIPQVLLFIKYLVVWINLFILSYQCVLPVTGLSVTNLFCYCLNVLCLLTVYMTVFMKIYFIICQPTLMDPHVITFPSIGCQIYFSRFVIQISPSSMAQQKS